MVAPPGAASRCESMAGEDASPGRVPERGLFRQGELASS